MLQGLRLLKKNSPQPVQKACKAAVTCQGQDPAGSSVRPQVQAAAAPPGPLEHRGEETAKSVAVRAGGCQDSYAVRAGCMLKAWPRFLETEQASEYTWQNSDLLAPKL